MSDIVQVVNEATLTQPPNLLQFDHPSKKRRTSPARIAGPSATAVPTIHLHLGDLPLNNQVGQRHLNITPESRNTPLSPAHDSDGDDLIAYPSIEILLHDLDEVMPAANFMRFHAEFVRYGVFYVDGIGDLSSEFLINEIGLPRGVVKKLQNHAAHLTRRAEKGKGRAEVIDLTKIQREAHTKEKENVE
jgi:hypothetical protein